MSTLNDFNLKFIEVVFNTELFSVFIHGDIDTIITLKDGTTIRTLRYLEEYIKDKDPNHDIQELIARVTALEQNSATKTELAAIATEVDNLIVKVNTLEQEVNQNKMNIATNSADIANLKTSDLTFADLIFQGELDDTNTGQASETGKAAAGFDYRWTLTKTYNSIVYFLVEKDLPGDDTRYQLAYYIGTTADNIGTDPKEQGSIYTK